MHITQNARCTCRCMFQCIAHRQDRMLLLGQDMSQITIVMCRLATEFAQIAKIIRRPSGARCCSKRKQKFGIPCQWNAGRQDQPESQHRCRRSCPGPGVHQRHASDLQHCHPHSTPSQSTRLHYHASCPASGTLVKQICLLIRSCNCP